MKNKFFKLILFACLLSFSFGFSKTVNSEEICTPCSWVKDYTLYECIGNFGQFAEGYLFNCRGDNCCAKNNGSVMYTYYTKYKSSCNTGETSYSNLGSPSPRCQEVANNSTASNLTSVPAPSQSCVYIKSVDAWSGCENGISVATRVTWATLSGPDCPPNADTTRSCCSYISDINSWSACEGGVSKATDYTTEIVYGASCPPNTAITKRCPPYVAEPLSLVENYCDFVNFNFSWNYNGYGNQSAYQLQIALDQNFNQIAKDTGKIISSSNSYTLAEELDYNTAYYWRVRVWDSEDMESEWSNAKQFTTPLHRYPFVNFSYLPIKNIRAQKEVRYLNESAVFDGSSDGSFFWSFEDASPEVSTLKNPIIFFESNGDKQVVLKVTDNDGFSCSLSKTISVGRGIIKWFEIDPFSFLISPIFNYLNN